VVYTTVTVAVRDPVSGLLSVSSPSSLLSWLMNKNDTNTTAAPIQYTMLEYCWYCIISPIRDSGIVSDRPTVTTSGVVRSIAYAHDMSLMKDDIEFAYHSLAAPPAVSK
jgi:hypothetical protein